STQSHAPSWPAPLPSTTLFRSRFGRSAHRPTSVVVNQSPSPDSSSTYSCGNSRPSGSAVSAPNVPASALYESGEGDWFTTTDVRSEEHTSELQSRENLVCRLLL